MYLKILKSVSGPRITILIAAVFIGSTLHVSAASAATDQSYEERQKKALRTIAAEFDPDQTYDNPDRRSIGQPMMSLLAAMEVHDRGMDEGIAIADARQILAEKVLPNLNQFLGTNDDPGPWSWQNTGSPAIKHAALALGMMVHRWGDELGDEVVDQIRYAVEESSWRNQPMHFVVNGRLSINAAQLLVGEYLGYDSSVWKLGVDHFNSAYERTLEHGGLEMNAPVYTAYHWPPLFLLQDLENEKMRVKARILLDQQLLVHGHLFLPGGGLGGPQSRDRSGGTDQRGSLPQMYWLFFGEEAAPYGYSWHQITAASRNWKPNDLIRSIFIDKPDTGYEFWTYSDAPARNRMPGTGYSLGSSGASVAPWHTVTMPDGRVQMGISYGHRYQAIHVSMGLYARDDDGGFQILYHYQPWVEGDEGPPASGDRRWHLPSSNGDADPDDFLREGYEYERLLYGRTMISIWNPEHTIHQDTRAHLPNWANHGGEMERIGDWFVGRMNDTYIAYRPLGPIEVDEERNDGDSIYLRLSGVSGCIIELAPVGQFTSLRAYGANLQQRHLEFDRDSVWVEFEALEVDSPQHATVPVRLEYHPENRTIDGRDYTMQDLDRGLIHSPFVRTEPGGIILEREGYGRIVYNTDKLWIRESQSASAE